MNTTYPIKHLNQLRPMLIGFRKENGLTQKEVSQRLGVTQQAYAGLNPILPAPVLSVCLEFLAC